MRISFEEASTLLNQGNIVAIPTETVYGLACRYDKPAIANIFTLKKRPQNNPLIMHLAAFNELFQFVDKIPDGLESLCHAFWPGPMTIVIPIREKTINPLIRSSLKTQAFRIPAHPLTQKLLTQTGPLVAPSANISGKPSSTLPKHVEEDFGKDFPILDGGACAKGVESTILVWNDGLWHLGRLGALPPNVFIPVLGYEPLAVQTNAPLICPGQYFRHYAPKATLHLTDTFEKAAVILGFSDRNYPLHSQVFSLGRSDKPEEALEKLYMLLRRLDEEGINEAFIDINVPKTGLWHTFLERIHKAGNHP